MTPTGPTAPADVLGALCAARFVPVVALDGAADAAPLAAALVEGGLPLVEVTFRTAAAADAIRAMADRGDVVLGAGTVLTPAQVDQAVFAGARYVVSPGLSRAVVERCEDHGVLALPGAVTATEVQAALELGLTTVKFFPAATSGGAAAISALAARHHQGRGLHDDPAVDRRSGGHRGPGDRAVAGAVSAPQAAAATPPAAVPTWRCPHDRS